MDKAKLVEKHLDTFDTVTVKLLPFALALVIGYLFAPDAFRKVLLGLDPVHASAGVWMFAAMLSSVRLRTVVALEALSQDPAAREMMRQYPSLSNIFYESGAVRFATAADLHGVVLTTAMSLLIWVFGIELLYTATFPTLLQNESDPTWGLIASYVVGQAAFILDTGQLLLLRIAALKLLMQVSSSEAVFERKKTTFTVVATVITFFATGRSLWLMLKGWGT